MAGRKPKPTALKVLAGNPGNRALNHDEPKPARNLPEIPSHLNGEARAEWQRITPLLLSVGVLTTIDRAALSAYCTAWARHVDAEEQLKKTGTIIKTPTGYPIQNPYIGISNVAMAEMRKYMVEFGMTPSSRSKIHANPDNNQTDASEEAFFTDSTSAGTLLV